MSSSLLLLRLLLASALALLATACGAGLVSGAVASGGGSSGGGGPPSLSLPNQAFPLVPGPTSLARTVVVANARITPSNALRVQLRVRPPGAPDGAGAFLAVADQASPVLVSGQGASTVVGFSLRTDPIVAVTTAETDVAAEIAVLVDGREVAPPLPVTLFAQPKARLLDGAPHFLSPIGGQVVRFACRDLRSLDATSLDVTITTANPGGLPAPTTRPCLRPTFVAHDVVNDPPLQPGERILTAEVPSNTFAGNATFVVEDLAAGRSGPVAGASYRPDVQVAVPPQGSTRGGTKVTLFGRALLPLGTAGAPDFDALRVELRKGDRIVVLDPAAIVRAESTFERLVFFAPPSPDGRAGDVGIALQVRLGGEFEPPLVAEVVANGLFLFANPEPVFGPRGALLDRDPVAVVPVALEGAPQSTQATDFAVLYSTGGAAVVQLLAGQENGLFIRFGPAVRVGDPERVGERNPRDLCSGDFDRDQVPDLIVLNGGGTTSTLLLVHGQAAPLQPLGRTTRIPAPGGMAKVRVGDFDGDGGPDLVLLPAAGAATPRVPVLLRSRVVNGEVSFLPPVSVPVRVHDYDTFEVADLDGDGALDVGVLAGRLLQRLDVAYGDGVGGFSSSAQLDFTVPRANYQPSAGSPAVGLHAMGAAPCALAIVLAGLPPQPFTTPPGPVEHPTTPATLFVLRPSGARGYAPAVPADLVQLAGAIDPFRASFAGNLDGVGTGNDELLVGTTGALGQFSLGLFRFDTAVGLGVVRVVVDFRPTEVAAFFLGLAFPADPGAGRPAQLGVFVQHELTVDGELERRLSTLLVSRDTSDILLLSPDVVFPVPLSGVFGGRFSSTQLTVGSPLRDVAVPSATQIQLGDNDGFGALSPGKKMVHSGLVPETAVRLVRPDGETDRIAFLDDGRRDGRSDGQIRVGVWRPDPTGPQQQVPQVFGPDLRALLPLDLRAEDLDPASLLRAEDVDSDGFEDLTILLRFDGRHRDGQGVLLLLHGRSTDAPDDFPYDAVLAEDLVRTHGAASALELADFAADSVFVPPLLELALAVPIEELPGVGNHVRFYRIGAGPRWVRSIDDPDRTALAVGDGPTQLVAADFDSSGTIDLMVANDDDATLRVFLNDGTPAANAGEVAIAALQESFGSPISTGIGRHTHLRLGDINGDGAVDVLLATEFTTQAGGLSTQVVFHLSIGAGEFGNAIRVSPTRLGNRNSRLSLDLGDINRDSVPDLTLGWFQGGTETDNLLVLLGGSL